MAIHRTDGTSLLLVGGSTVDQQELVTLMGSVTGGVHIEQMSRADALAGAPVPDHFAISVVSLRDQSPGWSHWLESDLPVFREVPVIMLGDASAHAMAIEGFQAGAHDWLVPDEIDPAILPSRLTGVITRFSRQSGLVRSEARYRKLLEDQHDLICRFLPDGTLSFVNSAYARYFGRTVEQLEGQSFLSMVAEPDRERVLRQLAALTPESPFISFDHEVMVDGRSTWRQWTDSALFSASGELLEFQSIGQDVTIRRQAEHLAVASEARYRSMYENAPVMIHIIDAQGDLISVNRCWTDTLGYSEEEVLGRKPTSFLTAKSREESRERVAATVQQGQPQQNVAIQFRHKLGHVLDVLITANADRDEQGNLTRITAVGVEVTDRVRAVKALEHEKERLRTTLASIGDAVITTDAFHQVDYLNPTAAALTGWSMKDAVGKSLQSVFRRYDLDTSRPIDAPLDIEGLANEPATLLLHHRLEDRSVVVELTAAPIKTMEGQVFGLVLVFRDVTEVREQSARMAWQASHDSLTGLLNRRAFEVHLQQVIASRHADNQSSHVLCFLDLDRFKLVNDSCGHGAGDELLCEITALMRSCLRNGDTLARLGGDEFAVLLEHCPLEMAYHLADGMREAVAGYRYRFGERVFSLGASIGLFSIDDPMATVEGCLQAADSACYAAKEAGRNRVHQYREDDNLLQRRVEETLWMPRLADALDNDRFELFAQAIEPADSRRAAGAHMEVLLRLREDGGRIVAPGAFIPIAERFQIMDRLDRWVITRAFEWLADHRQDLPALESFGINLSGQSLNEPQFLSFVESRLDSTGIPGEKICFEITETAAIDNVPGASSVMSALSARGCRFALDDFGSGLSSFAYLRSLPVDYLKIDGLFVRDILDDTIDFAMVRTINDIGQLLGKQTIAEYVENQAIQQRLVEIGVDWVQGYGVSKPAPLAELWAARVAGAPLPDENGGTARSAAVCRGRRGGLRAG